MACTNNRTSVALASRVRGLESYLGSLLIDPSRQLITLKTDAEESVQDMLTIMDIIRTAGGERIFLATDPKEKE